MREETIFQKIVRYFDKLEDHVRARLSHRSIIYALVGGSATVLFWRGIWHTADYLSTGIPFWLDGPFSLLLGSLILLITGLFVSVFIGDRIILSGLKGEKKIAEKTEEEVRQESSTIEHIHKELEHIHEILEEMRNKK